MLELNCQHCGETFVAGRSNAKWCSKSCLEKARYARDSEKLRERSRESRRKWREANPEKAKEVNLSWGKANPEKVREHKLRWRRANPEKVRENNFLYYNKAASTNALAHAANEIRKLNGEQNDQPE